MAQLGKYTLGRQIGQGGAGAVYESFHPILARPVAIKLMLTNDADARREFTREARTVAALSHPSIINIFDVDEHQGQPFLVMELLDTSLDEAIARGPFDLNEAIALLLPLLDALSYAHRQGLVHRDLKPANVLLRPDGTPVLADFGLAQQTSAQQSGAPAGTPEYMAPEQLRNEPLDARADIYALGALLFELLTGRPPFIGTIPDVIRGHLIAPPPSPISLNQAITPAAERLVLRMLQKRPDDRPQTVEEVAQALRDLPSAPPAPAHTAIRQIPATGQTVALPRSAAAPTPQRSRRAAWIAGSVMLGVAALGLLGGMLAPEEKSTGSGGETPGTERSVRIATAAPTSVLAPLSLRQLDQAPMAGAAPAANTDDFSVAGVTYEDDPTRILFYGELRNESDTVFGHVVVTIRLRDAAERVISSADQVIERSRLDSGATTPFMVYFTDDEVPNRPFDSYTVEVEGKPADSFVLGYYVQNDLRLEVTEIGRSSFGSIPVVRGIFYNDRTAAVGFPSVTAVFYNEAGLVIGITECYAEPADGSDVLAANDSAPFETIFFSMTERDASSYLLYAEGTRKP